MPTQLFFSLRSFWQSGPVILTRVTAIVICMSDMPVLPPVIDHERYHAKIVSTRAADKNTRQK